MAFAIIRQRLHNQGLEGRGFRDAGEAVAWLGAVQAQDYPAAKWALGLRVRHATDAAIEQAFASGDILRTHVLRPTWHFVRPADIRWLLALTGPRVKATTAGSYRRLGLDEATLARSTDVIGRALAGGRHLTRAELADALRRARIAVVGQRLAYAVLRAELDAVICSGPRRGRQFTYALLEERVPKTRSLTPDEALAEISKRYFRSHGPATLRDFVWWSGLTTREAKAGVALAGSRLEHRLVDGVSCWFVRTETPRANHRRAVHLLPNYDEYFIAYRDRGVVLEGSGSAGLRPDLSFAHQIAVGGRLRGSWRRTVNATSAVIEARPFTPLTRAERHALDAAVERHARFLGMPVTLDLAG